MKKHLLTFLSVIALGLSGQAQYCTTGLYSYGCTSGDDLGNFTLNTINNTTSGCPSGSAGYMDFTSISTTLMPNTAYNWSAYTNYGCCQHFAIWVDYNNDGDFNDAGEQIYTSSFTAGSWSGVYNTPLVGGTFRLRAKVKYGGSPMTSTDACTSFSFGETEDYTITIIPPVFTVLTPDTLELLCNNDSNGSITATAFSGTTPYTYLWNTGDTGATISNLPAGTYSVIATDSNGDMDTSYTVITQPDPIISTLTIEQNLVCNYDTSVVSVAGSGGTSISGYLVDTSGTYSPDTSQVGTPLTLSDDQVSSALDIGFDFVFFGDTFDEFRVSSNGFITLNPSTNSGCCSGQLIPNIFEPNNLIAVVWDDLYPPGNGTITYFTAGVAPFRRLVVTYTDIPFCCNSTASISAQAILYESTNCVEIHTAYANGVAPGTQGIENADGTEAYVYPGRNSSTWPNASEDFVSFCPVDTTGLIYSWSNGYSGSTQMGLQPGNYSVSVTDLNGCQNVHNFTIDPPVSHFVSAVDADDVSCFGFNDGFINPNITGGSTPSSAWNYTWSHGPTTDTAAGLSPGSYSVTVEDNVNCTIEVADIQITEPSILLGSVYGVSNAICENDSSGAASVVVTGGRPPYTPLWSNGTLGYTATNLTSGGHNVHITDSSGCSLYLPVNIGFDYPAPYPDLGSNIINTGGGTVTLSTAPATFTTYLWKNGSTGATLDVTQTGAYWVEVTNAHGCKGSDSIYVEIWPTGIEEVETDFGVSFFPNPAKYQINFEVREDIALVDVDVLDARGAIVASFKLNGAGSHTADISALAAGVYSVNMKIDGTITSIQKLMVQ